MRQANVAQETIILPIDARCETTVARSLATSKTIMQMTAMTMMVLIATKQTELTRTTGIDQGMATTTTLIDPGVRTLPIGGHAIHGVATTTTIGPNSMVHDIAPNHTATECGTTNVAHEMIGLPTSIIHEHPAATAISTMIANKCTSPTGRRAIDVQMTMIDREHERSSASRRSDGQRPTRRTLSQIL